MAMARSKKSDNPFHPSLFGDDNLPTYEPIRLYAQQHSRQDYDLTPSTEQEEPSLADDPVILNTDMSRQRINFISFGSGSSGNCSYVGDDSHAFLIDAGIDPEKIVTRLKEYGISMTRISGIFLTHDHGDHVRYAYSILRANRHMKLYCTPKVMGGLLRRHNISRRIKDYHQPIYKEFTVNVGRFTLTPFEVLHDGTDNAGYFIQHDGLSMAIATDLGCISPRVEHYMTQANFIMLESNYDLQMLMSGSYPDYLKARIVSQNGHLDNTDAAQFIKRIYTPALRYIFLCHLSKDNNTPQKAVEAYTNAFDNSGITLGDGSRELNTDLQLIPLPRFDATPMYTLRMLPRTTPDAEP